MTDDLVTRARKWAANRVKLDGGYSDEVAIIRDLCDQIDKLNRDLDLTLQAFEHHLERENEPTHRS
jgi:hypothetical protein